MYEWVDKCSNAMDDDCPVTLFKEKLLPVVFNILKRGESWSEFVAIGRDEIAKLGDKAPKGLLEVFTSKTLFAIVLAKSSADVRFHILRNFAAQGALPLLLPSLSEFDLEDPLKPLMVFNRDLFHLINTSTGASLLSFAIGEKAGASIGKSEMMKDIFQSEFGGGMGRTNFATHGSCDVDMGHSFTPQRKFAVADLSGELDMISSGQDAPPHWLLLGLFSHFIIHVHHSDAHGTVQKFTQWLQECRNGEAGAADGECAMSGLAGIVVVVRDCPGAEFVESVSSPELHSALNELKDVLGNIVCVVFGVGNMAKMDVSQRERVGRFQVQKRILDVLNKHQQEFPEHQHGLNNRSKFLAIVDHNRSVDDAPKEGAIMVSSSSSDSPGPLQRNSIAASPDKLVAFNEIDSVVFELMERVEGAGHDFCAKDAFATRQLLVDLRKYGKMLQNAGATTAQIMEAKLKKAQIEAELKTVQVGLGVVVVGGNVGLKSSSPRRPRCPCYTRDVPYGGDTNTIAFLLLKSWLSLFIFDSFLLWLFVFTVCCKTNVLILVSPFVIAQFRHHST